MPFIDDEQLAALYKEVDQEKKAAAFFKTYIKRTKLSCFVLISTALDSLWH